MDQLISLFRSLSLGQKASMAAAAILVVAGIVSLQRWNHDRDLKPLYTGLTNEDAGAIVTKLKESGTEYKVSDAGDAILVPSAKVAEIRLQMAAAGIPKSGRIGYELFDKNNFGATDFTEQVNYHRALEGELERSIMALAEVERARVHLSFGKESLFLDQRQPAKASVMLKLKAGGRISPQNVLAVTHMIASAVEGLTPEGVSVVDMNGTLLNRPRKGTGVDTMDVSDAALDFRKQVERDLIAKINTTLEPVLGPEKFRAGVSVECDFTSGEQSEESYDPARSVMVTSQKTEDVMSGSGTGGVPGTPSNLPRGPGKTASGYGTTRRTENIAYQSSRIVRHVKLPQGAVKRMSVSVLVDHSVRWEGGGAKAKRIIEPPSPEKMKVIRELVAGVTGLQADRGDQLIVETLPFETTLATESPFTAPQSAPSNAAKPVIAIPGLNVSPAVLIGVAVGAGLAFIAAVLVVVLRSKKKHGRVTATVDGPKEIGGKSDAADSLEKQLQQRLADQATERELQAQQVLASLKLPQVKTKKTEVLAKQIAEETKKDAQSMAQVLRGWLGEEPSHDLQ